MFSASAEIENRPTNLCNAPGCDLPGDLVCPVCQDQKRPFFWVCSSEHLSLAWPHHLAVHDTPTPDELSQMSRPPDLVPTADDKCRFPGCFKPVTKACPLCRAEGNAPYWVCGQEHYEFLWPSHGLVHISDSQNPHKADDEKKGLDKVPENQKICRYAKCQNVGGRPCPQCVKQGVLNFWLCCQAHFDAVWPDHSLRHMDVPFESKFAINRWGELRQDPARTPEQLARDQKAEKERREVEQRRESKWLQMRTKWSEWERKDPNKIKHRVRKGVPDAFRNFAWSKFSGMRELMQNAPPGYYTSLCAKESPQDSQINKDLTRTFPNMAIFRDRNAEVNGEGTSRGRDMLGRILKAYTLHDPKVGYTQGMGFLVAIFLMYFAEEEAFWMLAAILQSSKFKFHGLFEPAFPLLFEHFYIFERLLASRLPAVYQHLNQLGIHTATYATQWFLTFYSYKFPFNIVLRLIDVLMSEGHSVVFKLALFIMATLEKQLLAAEDAGVIIPLLSNVDQTEAFQDTDAVFEGVFKFKIKPEELAKLSAEFPSSGRNAASLAKARP